MHPILFHLDGVPIYSHGFFFLLGLLIGLAMLIYEGRRRRWPLSCISPATLSSRST